MVTGRLTCSCYKALWTQQFHHGDTIKHWAYRAAEINNRFFYTQGEGFISGKWQSLVRYSSIQLSMWLRLSFSHFDETQWIEVKKFLGGLKSTSFNYYSKEPRIKSRSDFWVCVLSFWVKVYYSGLTFRYSYCCSLWFSSLKILFPGHGYFCVFQKYDHFRLICHINVYENKVDV